MKLLLGLFVLLPCRGFLTLQAPRDTSLRLEIKETITLPPALPVDDSYPSPLHQIYLVHDLLTPPQLKRVLELSYEHNTTTNCWSQPSIERHATYATCDFAVDECAALSDYLEEIAWEEKVLKFLKDHYGIVHDAKFLDLFVACYQAPYQNHQVMDRLQGHRDGSLLSFTMVLNDDFQGGGTVIDNQALQLPPGGAVVHCGKIWHGAAPVTKGTRIVMVGFVDCYAHEQAGALGKAAKTWGRMDLAQARMKKQKRVASKWIHGGTSALQLPFVPQFASAQTRASDEFQQRKRREAEDMLLRNVLLSAEEAEEQVVHEPMELTDGDYTALED